jgi:hypothetical protein
VPILIGIITSPELIAEAKFPLPLERVRARV